MIGRRPARSRVFWPLLPRCASDQLQRPAGRPASFRHSPRTPGLIVSWWRRRLPLDRAHSPLVTAVDAVSAVASSSGRPAGGSSNRSSAFWRRGGSHPPVPLLALPSPLHACPLLVSDGHQLVSVVLYVDSATSAAKNRISASEFFGRWLASSHVRTSIVVGGGGGLIIVETGTPTPVRMPVPPNGPRNKRRRRGRRSTDGTRQDDRRRETVAAAVAAVPIAASPMRCDRRAAVASDPPVGRSVGPNCDLLFPPAELQATWRGGAAARISQTTASTTTRSRCSRESLLSQCVASSFADRPVVDPICRCRRRCRVRRRCCRVSSPTTNWCFSTGRPDPIQSDPT
ncbi:unnamed protein product [Soboliphyme baturini]|uniref:Uncharacterized protein n=1 Tax=Soboliphyme baturini TaxID=241478 RepID=A0A183IMQ4_9BILA|nr:unnamed protein product [Soboliphyme baturini]